MLYLILSCLVIMLASLSGKLLVWKGAGKFIERNLHLMVTFAAGIFLVFSWQLSSEVFEHMELVPGIVWILGGAVVVTLICKVFHHGETESEHEHKHSHLDAHRMLVSDSIHNAGDGILLAATYAVSPVVGFAATLSVFLHEMVQEIAEFFVLRDAGYSVNRALVLNFATSATILIGAIGGFVVLELFESLEGPLLAVATGGALSVVFLDLAPHSLSHARTNNSLLWHIVWFILGALLMYGMISFVPHQDPVHEALAQFSSQA